MKYIILILSIITFEACSQNLKKENPFSNEFVATKSEDLERVKGTKIFAKIPKKYEYVRELSRYQVSDQQFIQFQYIPNNSWNEYKSKLNKESFGKGLTIYEQVTFNGFDGMYIEGVDPNSDNNDIVLVFGANDFISMIIGKTSKQNPKGRNELIEILKSIYYERNYKLDELELANFEFDKSIADYNLAVAGNNIFMYAKNGKADAENPFANSMLFQTLPHMNDKKQMKYFSDMINRHKSKGYKLNSESIKEEKIEDYTFIKLESKIEFETKHGILNQVLINDGKSTLLFLGVGYEDENNLKNIFRKTIKTIKLK